MKRRIKTGTLVVEKKDERPDIRYSLNEYYGDLHCGQTLEVFVNNRWQPTRLEKADDWYLVGIPTCSLNGLRVRIEV